MKFEAIYKMLPLAAVVQKAWDQGSRCQDCQVSVGILEIPSNFAMAMDQFDCLIVAHWCTIFVLEQNVECQELFIVHGGLAANSADALPQAIFDWADDWSGSNKQEHDDGWHAQRFGF